MMYCAVKEKFPFFFCFQTLDLEVRIDIQRETGFEGGGRNKKIDVLSKQVAN